MKVELASIPSDKKDLIKAFFKGASEVLKHMPNQSGNDPMDIDIKYHKGNYHIYLITGRWIGPYKAEFDD